MLENQLLISWRLNYLKFDNSDFQLLGPCPVRIVNEKRTTLRTNSRYVVRKNANYHHYSTQRYLGSQV